MKSQMLTLESLEKMVSIHVFSALEEETVVVLEDIADLIAELAIVIMITDATTSVISELNYCFQFLKFLQILLFILDATKVVDMVIQPIPIRDLVDTVIAIVAVVLEAVAVAMETVTVSIVEHAGATIGTAKDLVANVPLEATEVVKNLLTLRPQAIVMPLILAMLEKQLNYIHTCENKLSDNKYNTFNRK